MKNVWSKTCSTKIARVPLHASEISRDYFILFSLMEQISIMFAETRETEVVLAPVVQAGLDALKV